MRGLPKTWNRMLLVALLTSACGGGEHRDAVRIDTPPPEGAETYHFQCRQDTYTVVAANRKDSIGPFPVSAAQAGSETMKRFVAVCRDSLR